MADAAIQSARDENEDWALDDQATESRDNLPKLERDPSFLGMLSTQFLGAFNDNLFKQLVLLICIDMAIATQRDWQGIAQALFALPFVMISGFAGWLSDRTPKRGLVVICKVAEIVIMAAGLIAFFVGGLRPENLLIYLFIVLALMSVQSAFFGPAKYGILPELFRERDLPAANGWIQMTTFLAIIFGMALAGYGKQALEVNYGPGSLWILSAVCVGIAVLGTATSLFIRKTPIAQPGLPLRPSSLLVDSSLWSTLLGDRKLMGVLFASSLFWMIGGLVPVTVNAFGKMQLGLDDTRTSLMAACMGVGIAIGCVLAGRWSRGRVRFELVTRGAWGLIAAFLVATAIGYLGTAEVGAAELAEARKNPFAAKAFDADNPAQWPAYLTMVALGGCAGLFAVPLQVFLQHRPPRQLKGRMIGAMNLANWIGILLSAGLYGALAMWLAESREYHWIFLVAAGMLLPVALFYRPESESLEEHVSV